jgi:two-component system, chemotaxis family, sensor kinase CheA
MDSDSRDELTARLRATFLAELEDLLRDAEQHLTRLNATPADGDALSALFRVMHTLKGAGRAAGYPFIETLCHQLESLLADARDSGQPLGPAELATLSAGLDALTTASTRIHEGRAPDAPAHEAHSTPVVEESPEEGLAPTLTATAPIEEVPAQQVPTSVAAPAAQEPSTSTSSSVRIDPTRLDSLLAASTRLLVLGGRIRGQTRAVDDVSDLALAATATWRKVRREVIADLEALSPRLSTLFQDLESSLRSLSVTGARAVTDSRAINASLHSITDEIGVGVRSLRLRPFSDITEGLPRTMRALAAERSKEVDVEITGEHVEADRSLLDEIKGALLHLVRNAIDHGIEAPHVREAAGKPREAVVKIDARVVGDRLVVTVSDDGAGINVDAVRRELARRGLPIPRDDRELGRAIFRSGVSTREGVDAISGRGVGLDAVRDAMRRSRGIVDVAWTRGKGTTFRLDAPVTLATLRALLVSSGSTIVAIPTVYAERLIRVRVQDLPVADGRVVVPTGEAPAPIVQLGRLIRSNTTEQPETDGPISAVLVAVGDRRVVLAVDELLGEQELVVQPIRAGRAGSSALVSAAAILSSGKVAVVANVPGLVAQAGGDMVATEVDRTPSHEKGGRRARILVVDDSITTRTLEQSVLEAAGYEVYTGVDGADGWRLVQERSPDLVVADVEMPRMDGFTLCETIRKSPRFKELPVVLITALETPEHRARGLEAGADAYLGKSSFDQETLIETVRQLLR